MLAGVIERLAIVTGSKCRNNSRAGGTGSMAGHTLESMTERFDLADQLLFGRSKMLEPQNLPGRYGRVVRSIDHLLQVLHFESVLAGGWAVWWHGYEGRLTQDVDIVLAAEAVQEFLRAAAAA